MAINFYEDLSVYNHVVVEGGFFAGNAVDTNYDLKIKGASLLQNTLAVSGIVTLSSVANASSDPDKFLCINGSNQVEYRTGAQVLSDIGAASSSSLSNYLPLAGGTMTGTTSHGDNVKSRFGTGNDLTIYATGTTSILDIPAGNFYIGDYETFDTASFSFARVSGETGMLQPEEGWFAIRVNASNNHIYLGSDGTDVVEIDHNSMLLYDNMKLKIGSSSDLQIYHDGSNSYIDDAGTGSLSLRTNFLKIETYTGGERMATFDDNGSVSLYYDDSIKLATDLKGIAVTGDVLDRDIPCLFNSNFFDGTSTSIFVVPFNSLQESTVSNRTYYHNLTMPYDGKLVKVVMKNVSGTLSSGFTTQLFLYVNGSQQASSAELSLSNSAVTWTPSSSNTFSAGDELTFAYQKSTSGATFSGVSFGVAVELTDYDI